MTEVCSLSSGLYEITKMSVQPRTIAGALYSVPGGKSRKFRQKFMWKNASLSTAVRRVNFDPGRLVADFALSSDDLTLTFALSH